MALKCTSEWSQLVLQYCGASIFVFVLCEIAVHDCNAG
jgi:hypothetical protein